VRYGYYPGCSLRHTAGPYDSSSKAVASQLGLKLEEVEDWNCCGATEYFALNRTAAYALVARNLALAEAQFCAPGNGAAALVAPCSACYLNLRKTDHHLHEHADLQRQVGQALAKGGLAYHPGSLSIRHLLDVVIDDVGLDVVKARVTRPLRSLRIAPYYGCLLTRPEAPGQAVEEAEYPTRLDNLLRALGAEVVDFPLKTHCCGGHLSQISADTAYAMLYRLLRSAAEYQADLICTICPMCQMNLDAYQGQVNKRFDTDFALPVLYFTQLLGLAFEVPAEDLGLGREIVSARTALAKIGVEEPAPPVPEAKPKAARKKGDKALPMPVREAPKHRRGARS
jgi:heterodisulfide reductase subunit B